MFEVASDAAILANLMTMLLKRRRFSLAVRIGMMFDVVLTLLKRVSIVAES